MAIASNVAFALGLSVALVAGVTEREAWEGEEPLRVDASGAMTIKWTLRWTVCIFIFFQAFIFSKLWDAYVVWAVFIVVGIECVGVAYGYGAAKFSEEVQKGAGRAVPRFIQMCWSFITPFLCSVLAVASFAALCAGGGRYEGARATPAALVLGFLLMLGPVVVMIGGARDDCVTRPGRQRNVELASSPKRTRQMV